MDYNMDNNDNMDYDSTFMDELFFKIQHLEQEKAGLEAELNILETELSTKELKQLIQYDDRDISILNEIKLRNEDTSLAKVVKNHTGSMKEVTIEYIPFDNFNALYITGDFTNWQREVMIKQINGTFAYPTLLMKGFQYAYHFLYNEEVLIDFNKEYSENARTGMTNNVIVIEKGEGEGDNHHEVKIFQFEQDYPILEDMRKDYKKVCVENADEYEVFDKIVHFSNFIKEQVDNMSCLKESKMIENKNFYDEKLKKLNELANSRFQNINGIFSERIIALDKSLFLIKSILVKEGVIKGIYLYDRNDIKVNIDFHIKGNQLESIELKNLFNFHHIFIYSREESEALLLEYKDNAGSVLKIYYQLLNPNELTQDFEYNEHNFNINIRDHNKQKELIPYKIVPETVDINQYDIAINNNIIVEVRGRDTRLSVLFEAILIKEESGGKLKGFISSSSLKVYTTLYNKDIVNIIHIHLNDTSEEIAVDSVFLEKNQSVNDFKNFSVDYMGKKLNYKFLFRDYKLIKIFYNLSADFIDEPSFEEVRVNSFNFFKITGHDTYLNFYGKIKNIPIGMLVRKDKEKNDLIERLKSSEIKKEGYCLERHLEELPGFVDVEILFNPDVTMLERPVKLSLPICSILPLTPKEVLVFEKALLKAQHREKNATAEKLNRTYEEFVKLEEFVKNPIKLNEVNLEQAKTLIADLDKDFKGLFVNCLEESDNIEKFNFIIQVKENLIPMLHQHIRVLMLTGGK